jgi:hypothetical protein
LNEGTKNDERCAKGENGRGLNEYRSREQESRKRNVL